MNRIFRRFVVLVLLAITLATGVTWLTLRALFGDPLDELARRQAAGQIFVLEQYIDQAPADEWLARLNKVREVSAATFELLPLEQALAALPERQRASLRDGAIVLDVAGKGFYRRVDLRGARYIDSEREVLHAQHLPIDVGQALGMEAIRFLIIALFLLVPIGWWSRGHWRDLQALSRVADEMGHGRLTARAAVRPGSGIAPLAGHLHDMAGRIAGLLEARKQLLHSVSHELRTPIARLAFGLELLRGDGADAALERRIAAMEGDVGELNTLVNELLSVTQLDQAPAMQRQPVALGPLLRAAAEGVAPALAGKRLACDIEDDIGICSGDRRLLARALGNLLANGAKYAATTLTLSARRLPHGAIRIVVGDDGPGIPEAARERVFEPFYRLARDADHAAGGYGLGLAIARKAVQLHGGEIAIGRSALGGASFTLTLPGEPAGGADAIAVIEAGVTAGAIAGAVAGAVTGAEAETGAAAGAAPTADLRADAA
ncbi:MAG: ATP-binding protein [Pseudomonadota bacterium]